MTEDNNTGKPKATLIKHIKRDPMKTQKSLHDETQSGEKKKVVVVKKKKIVVKRPVVNSVASTSNDSNISIASHTSKTPNFEQKTIVNKESGLPVDSITKQGEQSKNDQIFEKKSNVSDLSVSHEKLQKESISTGSTSNNSQQNNSRNSESSSNTLQKNEASSENNQQNSITTGKTNIEQSRNSVYQGNQSRGQGYQGQSRSGAYQGNNQRSGGYQGSQNRETGGYPNNQSRNSGYQGSQNRNDNNYQGAQQRGGFQGSAPRSGNYQGNNPRQGGYQGNQPRQEGGYQGNQPRTGGYQGNNPRPGYQGNNPRPNGYQGNAPRTGYQGNNPRQEGGYQGSQPRSGGYQGNNPRPGYQGGAPRTGGYQGSSPRPGGYQGNSPRPGGYQGGQPRQDGSGFQGNQSRTGGYQGGGAPRSGGFRPGGSNPRPGAGRPDSNDDATTAQKTVKKVFKKKKPDYQKKKEVFHEKDFQIKKKSIKKANPVPKKIDIMEVITVSELAKKMNLKASEIISKLMSMGMMVTMNQQIDSDTAQILAEEYDCSVNIVSLYDETIIAMDHDEDSDLRPRPPIVTVMGHVDHGKTKLLDAIRKTSVVDGEFGGITQHIGAYKVALPQGEVVFLDTPGHAAFTLMRARGAQVTDIVILVVAANDGVMPQTIEAIDHAKAAKVPIIVAVNKIDLPESNIDRVKQQLSEYGLMPEAWGGTTLFCEISALRGEGIDELLETILLQAEILELKANYSCRAEGKIIESKVDHGRGIVSTVIIERGLLQVGDSFVAGVYPGKVRAIFDDKGNKINEAGPATPVEILGFTGIPSAGAPFQVTENDKQARQVGSKRQELERQGEANSVKKVTLDNLFDSIQDGAVQELKVIIKGDVHGSVEALQTALEKLSTKEVRLIAIHTSAGAIIENDINLAIASNAIVIGFNVRPTPKAQLLAEREKIDIRKYNIIYDAVDDIRKAMEGLLAPEYKEQVIGTAEVREIFKVPKIGIISGSYVLDGKVKRNATAHIIRDSIKVHTGKINSLKRFKDDAKTVDAGYECGIGIENFQDIRVGDIFEVVELIEVAKKLK